MPRTFAVSNSRSYFLTQITPKSYFLLALAVFIFESIRIIQDSWAGDFWEHASVVNELSYAPFHPHNPILSTSTTHAFFSPYALIVSIFSKVTNLDAIDSLTVFASVNLVFFLYAFYRFCKALFKESYAVISTMSLLLILFIQGFEPFSWSGFFHIQVLHRVLPYPSTFCMALSLFTLAILLERINTLTPRIIFFIAVSIFCVLISHPPTGVFLCIKIFCAVVCFNSFSIYDSLSKCCLLLIPGLILSLVWPYFNIVDLLTEKNSDFESDCKKLYYNVLEKNWPVLLMLPGFLVVKLNRSLVYLIISILVMTTVYSLGYMLGMYGFSRLISTVLLVAHIITGYHIVDSIKRFQKKTGLYLLFIGMFLGYSLYKNRSGIKYTLLSQKIVEEDYTKYYFLNSSVNHYDLILTDSITAWKVPAFSGKVISSIHPLLLVKNMPERRKYVALFFDRHTTDLERSEIIKKFRPDYILLNLERNDLSEKNIMWIERQGIIKYSKWPLELIHLK